MRLLSAFCIAWALTANAWSATDEAMRFYEQKDFPRAFAEFTRMAEVGDHSSQFNLGVMYYRGEHVARDLVQAYAWMSLANQQKEEKWSEIAAAVYQSLDAQHQAAADQARQLLFERLGDDALARARGQELVVVGSAASAVRVTRRITPEYPQSMRKRARPGWVELIFSVAPDGTTRNHGVTYASDKEFIEPALDAIKGWTYQPVMIEGRAVEVYGEEIRFNFQMMGTTFREEQVMEVVEAQREKAEQGDPAARYRHAKFLELLPGYTRLKLENLEPNRWHAWAAQDGYGPAQFSLGKNLLYGRACTADTAKSLDWLQRSAAAGQPDSQYLLAIELLSGVRLGRNPDSAIRWLQRASDRNMQHAQLKLAWLYATSPDEKQVDAVLAKMYVDKIEEAYADRLSLLETRAAVAAAAGDFRSAVDWQLKAVEEAGRYRLPLDGFNAKLAGYRENRRWLDAV